LRNTSKGFEKKSYLFALTRASTTILAPFVNVSTFREAIVQRFCTARWFRRIYVYGAAADDGVFRGDSMIALIAVAKLGKPRKDEGAKMTQDGRRKAARRHMVKDDWTIKPQQRRGEAICGTGTLNSI
jgi:hypothetical protein